MQPPSLHNRQSLTCVLSVGPQARVAPKRKPPPKKPTRVDAPPEEAVKIIPVCVCAADTCHAKSLTQQPLFLMHCAGGETGGRWRKLKKTCAVRRRHGLVLSRKVAALRSPHEMPGVRTCITAVQFHCSAHSSALLVIGRPAPCLVNPSDT